MACWGLRTAQGDAVCLRRAVEERLVGGTLLRFAGEGGLQAMLHQACSHVSHRAGVHGERCGQSLIAPGGAIGIRFEEDVGMFDLVCRRFPLAYHGIKWLTFLALI
jgi:hypothetical protein